jgi:hypothetical protein
MAMSSLLLQITHKAYADTHHVEEMEEIRAYVICSLHVVCYKLIREA